MARIPVSSIYTSMLPPLNPCWEKVLHLAQRRGYPRGSRLTLNTERENYFYFLARGRISILQDLENGKTRAISTLEAGTLINVTHALARQVTDFIEKGRFSPSTAPWPISARAARWPRSAVFSSTWPTPTVTPWTSLHGFPRPVWPSCSV